MKKIIPFLLVLSSVSFAANCKELATKYNAPDPSTKTMAQISRWVERKVADNPADAQELEACLIVDAADNPNKEQVAGK